MYRIIHHILIIVLLLSCNEHQAVQDVRVNSSSKEPIRDSADLLILESDIGPERVVWQKPEVVIHKMGDLRNKKIADIGAGVGFFTFRLLQTSNEVIASDIDTGALSKMKMLASKLDSGITSKLKIVVATESDPNLGNEKVDIIFICNTYIYLKNRVNYLKNLKKYLLPRGRIFILDYKQKNMPFGPSPDEKIALYVVENELTKAGYQVVQTDDMSLDYQYIVIAEKP